MYSAVLSSAARGEDRASGGGNSSSSSSSSPNRGRGTGRLSPVGSGGLRHRSPSISPTRSIMGLASLGSHSLNGSASGLGHGLLMRRISSEEQDDANVDPTQVPLPSSNLSLDGSDVFPASFPVSTPGSTMPSRRSSTVVSNASLRAPSTGDIAIQVPVVQAAATPRVPSLILDQTALEPSLTPMTGAPRETIDAFAETASVPSHGYAHGLAPAARSASPPPVGANQAGATVVETFAPPLQSTPTFRQRLAFHLDTSRTGRILDLADAVLSFLHCALYVFNTTYAVPANPSTPSASASAAEPELLPLFVDRTELQFQGIDEAMASMLGGPWLETQSRRKNAIPLPMVNIGLELVLAVCQLAIFAFRGYVAPRRAYFLSQSYALFTLLSCIPVLVAYAWAWRDVEVYMSYMSAGTVVYFFPLRWARFHEVTATVLLPVKDPIFRLSAISRKAAAVTCAILFTLLTVTALVHISLYKDDRQLVRDATFADVFYFTVMSSTSGLSTSIQADSWFTRALLLFIMVAGAFYIPTHLSELLTMIRNRSQFTKPYQATNNQSHVIVTGTFDVNAIVEFLREFFCPDHGSSTITTTVVFLNPNEPSEEIVAVLQDPAYMSRVTYIRGTPTSFRALDRAKAREARAVFVLCSKLASESGDLMIDDAETVMRSLAVKKYYPKLPVFVESMLPENQSQFHYLADQILCVDELTLGMMSQSSRLPGFAALISLLCSSMTDASRKALVRQADKQNLGFLKPYIRGASQEVYACAFPPALIGRTFIEVSKRIYLAFGACLIALGVPVDRQDLPPSLRFHLVLNPISHVITGRETGFLIGSESEVVEELLAYDWDAEDNAETVLDMVGLSAASSAQTITPAVGNAESGSGLAGTNSASIPRLFVDCADQSSESTPLLPGSHIEVPLRTGSGVESLSSNPNLRGGRKLFAIPGASRAKLTGGESDDNDGSDDDDDSDDGDSTAMDLPPSMSTSIDSLADIRDFHGPQAGGRYESDEVEKPLHTYGLEPEKVGAVSSAAGRGLEDVVDPNAEHTADIYSRGRPSAARGLTTGSQSTLFPPSATQQQQQQSPRRHRRRVPSPSATGTLLQAGRVVLDDAAPDVDVLEQHVRDHIILCDAAPNAQLPDHIDLFFEPLRDPLIARPLPVVILSNEDPPESVFAYPEVYHIRGNPLRRRDLVRAGVERASRLVILCSQKDNKRTVDAGSILCALNAESTQRVPALTVEFVHKLNFKFIGETEILRDVQDSYAQTILRPAYMAGHAFSSSLFDGLLAQSYYSPHVLSLIKRLIFTGRPTLVEKLAKSSSKPPSILPSQHTAIHEFPVPRPLIGAAYKDLYAYLASEGMVPLGLYRSLMVPACKRPICMTLVNPRPGMLLRASDRVFVLSNHAL
ncbi:hypothetical protein H9P43_008018 [Blastocladiella emersonii ATCC 22665]|nr:hypothetical protein H9P43_008018 [Blastocladiella emersonii ATCC 22665]